MISTFNLSKVLTDQYEWFHSRSSGITRDINLDHYRAHSQIVIISGIRRSGKSTLLKQFADGFPDYLYLNLDDDRLIGATIQDLGTIIDLFEELYSGVRVLFLDEVQNVIGWERLVRRIHENGYRVFLTGSNAHLLSSELGTHLTGRYVKIDLWPFGFGEYCTYQGLTLSPLTSIKEAEILRNALTYLEGGGFPEYLNTSDSEILRRIYEDIIFRDLIGRYRIRDTLPLRELARYLFTNSTRETNYNVLARAIGVSNPMSIRNWIGYFEECFLIFPCYRFDYSLKRQFAHNRKYYSIDTGLRNAVSFRFSDDHGLLLENMVYIELLRRGLEVFWFKKNGECDFIISVLGNITSAIQVCYELTDDNRDREIQGLMEAIDLCGGEGKIITFRQNEIVRLSGYTIRIIPFWRWVTGMD